jgi:hypothetical protein
LREITPGRFGRLKLRRILRQAHPTPASIGETNDEHSCKTPPLHPLELFVIRHKRLQNSTPFDRGRRSRSQPADANRLKSKPQNPRDRTGVFNPVGYATSLLAALSFVNLLPEETNKEQHNCIQRVIPATSHTHTQMLARNPE